jgi:MFS family permease
VLAATAALSQPWVGRARDAGHLTDRTGVTLGLVLTAAGLVVPALLPELVGLLIAAGVIGLGIGMITPLAFATLAATSPRSGWAKPWAPPRSAASSATPAGPSSSARSPPRQASVPGSSASPHYSP